MAPPLSIISDATLFDTECTLVVLLAGGGLLLWLVRRLRETRPGFLVATPIVVAFVLRFVAAIGIGQLPSAQSLRGGDELTFLARARGLAELPLAGSDSWRILRTQLHVFLLSLHDRVLGTVPELMARTEMITFSVIAVALVAAAVYELAGARPALIAAWLLALEPTNIFFSSLIHKEPLMFMAEALVVFGGAVLWKRGKLYALVPTALGCLIALSTRPYVGYFLTAAAAAVFLHGALTKLHGVRSLAVVTTTAVLIAVLVPVFLQASSAQNLKTLQISQNFNAGDSSANLSLERVDYSTRQRILVNLPKRIADIITKPYIWQTQNLSQRLGVIGTLVLLVSLVLLAGGVVRNRRALMARAGPIVYPAVFILCAYALSAGNAGTAFRYRTHVMALALALIVVLRAYRREQRVVPEHAGLPQWKNVQAAPTLVR